MDKFEQTAKLISNVESLMERRENAQHTLELTNKHLDNLVPDTVELLLDFQTRVNIAHSLLTFSVGNYADEVGIFRDIFPVGCQMEHYVGSSHNKEAVTILDDILIRITQAYEGVPLALILNKLGLSLKEQERALFRLVMCCMGHGISPDDDYEWTDTCKALNIPEPTNGYGYDGPLYLDDEFSELAEDYLKAHYDFDDPNAVFAVQYRDMHTAIHHLYVCEDRDTAEMLYDHLKAGGGGIYEDDDVLEDLEINFRSPPEDYKYRPIIVVNQNNVLDLYGDQHPEFVS